MSEAKFEHFQFAHAPVTFSIGFLEAECNAVAQAFHAWSTPLFRSVDVQRITGDLSSLVSQLEPLTAPPQRSLLIPTRSQWTAYLDNFINGTDAFGPVSHLAQVLNCRAVVLTCVPTPSEAIFPSRAMFEAVQFEIYGPGTNDPLGCVRSISVARDAGRLRFDASGLAQPFEDVERYNRRAVDERFTPAMLERYAIALEIAPFDEAFYLGEAQLFFYANVAPARQCSIAEARRERGLS